MLSKQTISKQTRAQITHYALFSRLIRTLSATGVATAAAEISSSRTFSGNAGKRCEGIRVSCSSKASPQSCANTRKLQLCEAAECRKHIFTLESVDTARKLPKEDCLLDKYSRLMNTTKTAVCGLLDEMLGRQSGVSTPIIAQQFGEGIFTSTRRLPRLQILVQLKVTESHVRNRRLCFFTNEQLFFVSSVRFSFSNSLQNKISLPQTATQSIGILRKNGAFRDAFNCHLNLNYALDTSMCVTLVKLLHPVVINK